MNRSLNVPGDPTAGAVDGGGGNRTRVSFPPIILALLAAITLAPSASARPAIPGPVFKAIRTYWPTRPERVEAFDVAWCESRFSPYAQNGQYLGLFQMGEFARLSFGHGWTALAQARAAYRYYRVAGWSPWECG